MIHLTFPLPMLVVGTIQARSYPWKNRKLRLEGVDRQVTIISNTEELGMAAIPVEAGG